MKTLMLLLRFFFIAFLCFTCDKDIEYNFKSLDPRIVVNGFISQEGVEVTLSSSIPPNIDSVFLKKLYINDAVVRLKFGINEEVILSPVGKGTYLPSSPFSPTAGQNYFIEVEHVKFGTVRSSIVTIPDKPVLTSIKVDSTDKVTTDDEKIWSINLSLRDDGKTNYYGYGIFNSYLSGTIIAAPNRVNLKNPSATNTCEKFNSNQTLANVFFKNNCFSGKELNLQLESELNYWYLSPTESILPDSLKVRIISVTNEGYEYFRSRVIPEDFEHTFSDPRSTKSNIIGGYGMFVAYSKVEFDFKIP